MQLFRKKPMLAAGIGMIFLLLFSVIFIFLGVTGTYAPRAVFACVLFLLLNCTGFLAAALTQSMRITLYAYKNIAFCGGIIFTSVMSVVALFSYYSCKASGEFSLSSLYKVIMDFPRSFSLYGLGFIILVSIVVGVSNIALIRREGLSRNNILSIVLAGFYIAAAVLVYFISDILSKYVFSGQKTDFFAAVSGAALPMFLSLMLCYIECMFVGSMIMGLITARAKPAYDKDFIIILGCSIDKKGGLLPLLKGRVNAAIRFAWQQEIESGRPAKYVPSGGQGANEVMSEGSAMELYLLTRGAEDYEVFPEKKSVNTYENFLFSKRIIDEIKPDANIAFATTNYHILRSGILARKAGFNAEGIAGDTKWYFWPNGFIREFFGILAIKKKAHLRVAAVIAVLCLLFGIVGFTGRFI